MSHPNPFADGPLPAEAARLHSAADAHNPYASPVHAEFAQRTETIGVWRDGPLVVMHYKAKLPERCVVTGEPAPGRHWQTLHATAPAGWDNRALVVEYGLSDAELRKLKKLPVFRLALAMFFAAVIFGTYLALLFVIQPSPEVGENWATVCVFIWAGIAALIFYPLLKQRAHFQVVQATKPYVWLSGGSPAFLQSLPAWPG